MYFGPVIWGVEQVWDNKSATEKQDAVVVIIWFYCTNDTPASRRRSFPDGQYSVYYRRPQIDCLQTQLWPSINSFHQAEVHTSPLVYLCVCVCVDKVNLHRGAVCDS